MAGIIATSATTNNSGSTATDTSVTGYIAGEAVTLTTTPTGASYSWSLSVPSGSTRSILTSTTVAAPRFTPDVAGYYVITCTVDSSTVYVMRLAATALGSVGVIDALRFVPTSDASIPTPSLGVTLYYSSTQSSLAIKLTDGTVETIDSTAV